MAKPRIFIGICAYSHVSPETLDDYMRFMFHIGRRMPDYDFFHGIISKSEQFRARNALVTGALQVNADYLLMLDDDMIIDPFRTTGPNSAYDFLKKLLAHGKDIVGALYYQRMGGYLPVAMTKSGDRGYRFLRPDEITGGLQRVDVTGGGAMLVNMLVFDKIGQPWFAPEHEFGTDVQLCRKAAEAGFNVWLDSSIEMGHVKEERVTITSQNRDRYAIETATPGEIKQQNVNTDTYNTLLADALEFTKFRNFEDMALAGQRFLTDERRDGFMESGGTNAEWYREYPIERVARQVWFNTANLNKKQMTQFILQTIGDQMKVNILDFGCGISIPGFEFAKRGHRVTCCDVRGTGTLDFLRWRLKKHGVTATIHESESAIPPLGESRFAAIIAMDVLEHIPEWRQVLADLASRLEPGGLFFCNNGILEDDVHPEHYPLDNKEFYQEALKNDLTPFNAIAFMKRGPKAPV